MPNFRSTEEAFELSRPRLKRGEAIEGFGLNRSMNSATQAWCRLLKKKSAKAAPKVAPKKGGKK